MSNNAYERWEGLEASVHARKEAWCLRSAFINFYIYVEMLYDKIIGLENFCNTVGVIESLAAPSIFTGNDKNPRVRHVIKPLALNFYKEACKTSIARKVFF